MLIVIVVSEQLYPIVSIVLMDLSELAKYGGTRIADLHLILRLDYFKFRD